MDKKETINYLFEQIRSAGLARTQRDFAALLGINEKGFSAAMNGNEKYLTDSLVSKVTKFSDKIQISSAKKVTPDSHPRSTNIFIQWTEFCHTVQR